MAFDQLQKIAQKHMNDGSFACLPDHVAFQSPSDDISSQSLEEWLKPKKNQIDVSVS